MKAGRQVGEPPSVNVFHSFEEFWPFYVCEHSKPLTRALHFVGTAALIPLVAVAVANSLYLLLLVPVVGYGLAWVGHFLVEKNRPATFKHPLWSMLGDFKMFGLMCIGRMEREVARCRQLRRQSSL